MFFVEHDNEDDGYDIEADVGINPEPGDIYGDINEEIEFQVIDNPYYGGEIELGAQRTNNARKKANLNDVEVVTSVRNIYYEM